jgi:hypothetical protein
MLQPSRISRDKIWALQSAANKGHFIELEQGEKATSLD